MKKKSGKLIVFYGTNNLGKTTQAHILLEKLQSQGLKSQYLKYPIYDLLPSGQILNDYLRNANPNNLNPREAQIIYTLNRTQFQNELEKKLQDGYYIIAEDYTGTGLAWGQGAGVNIEFLENINQHLLQEDLAILFDGERFKNSIEANHKHEEDDEFSHRVRQIHLDLAKKFNWKVVPANLSREEVAEKIWQIVKKNINN
ncbi:MAG: dTMP kinase [Patescibacteria group bacterium]|jgi:thymidylate kinase|nr:hypothetical protein [Patescibacteria group bacterium]